MNRIIKFSNKKPPQRIRDIGARSEKLESAAVADALGAEIASSSDIQRGRPVGWQSEMRAALGAVSEALQEAGDEDIRQALEAVRARRRTPVGGC